MNLSNDFQKSLQAISKQLWTHSFLSYNFRKIITLTWITFKRTVRVFHAVLASYEVVTLQGSIFSYISIIQ